MSEGRHAKASFINRVPRGVREQPAWLFIGFLFFLIGLGYATGYTDSSISRAVGDSGLMIWGVSLCATGLFLIAATIKGSPALEKFSLRVLTCNLLAYGGWLVTVVPFNRAASTLILAIALSALAEFRVLHLKTLMHRATLIHHELDRRESDE